MALTTQCAYCLEIHKGKAIAAGVTQEELAETTFLAAALRAWRCCNTWYSYNGIRLDK